MSSTRKFMVFGPADTLSRMSQTILDSTAPQYSFRTVSTDKSLQVDVLVYEEHQKLLNSSVSVTLVMEYTGRAVRADIVTTGGRMGFRGSTPEGETPLNEVVTDHILDFAKRYGLTIQEAAEKASTESE